MKSRRASGRNARRWRRAAQRRVTGRLTRLLLEPLEERILLASDLLLAEPATDSILRFDGRTGAPLGAFVSSQSGGLIDPHNPTFGPNGDLYVFSKAAGAESILRYAGATGAFVETFVPTGRGGFTGGTAMAFGPDGDLYVATGGPSVLRFAGDSGAFVGVAADGQGMTRACGIEFGPDGLMYVLDADSRVDTLYDRILRFDPVTSAFVDVFVPSGSLEDACAFAFGPDGHLYVPDLRFGQVRSFHGTTGALQTLFSGAHPDTSALAFDVLFGSDGNAYLPTADGVVRYDGETRQYVDTFMDGVGGTITQFPRLGASTDLAVTDLQSPVQVVQRADAEISFTVRNLSPNPVAVEDWIDVIYLSEDAVWDPLDQEIARIAHHGGLAGGAEYTEQVAAPLRTIALGTYRVFVFADRRGEVLDPNRANNRIVAPTSLDIVPHAATGFDPTRGVAVGRTLSALTTVDLAGGHLTVTYTVYNRTDGYVRDASLVTTLETGVSLVSASRPASEVGQRLSWELGTLTPFEHASVQVELALTGPALTRIDAGPEARGTIDGVDVLDALGPAILGTVPLDPAWLAATVDADTTDPWIQGMAAELDQDPVRIFEFARDDIDFESYGGSLRGARGTLWSGAGNALDQSNLLVALFRASGVPARYAAGTISETLAGDLIESMFPEPQVITGFIDPGTPVSDPRHDPVLLAEATAHYWVQFLDGGVLRDADPSFTSALVGQSFAPLDEAFVEVRDDLRHKVGLRLERELTTPAVAMLGGGSGQETQTVLEAIFTTAELVGRPVTVGFFTQTNTIPSPIFTSTTHVYSPYFLVRGRNLGPKLEEVVRGVDFQETLTNFPFGSQILTGLFLNVDVIVPGGFSQAFRTTIADRIGPAVRAHGGEIASDGSGQPLVTFSDLTTLNILPGEQSRASVVRDGVAMEQSMVAFSARMKAIGVQDARTTEGRARLGAASRDLTNLLIAAVRARLAQVAAGSDLTASAHAESAVVKAYFDSPRVHVMHTLGGLGAGSAARIEFITDLLKNDIRAIAFPGQIPEAAIGFRVVRGISDTLVEQAAFEPPTTEGPIIPSTGVATIFSLAEQQGIAFRLLTPLIRAELDSFDIGDSAKAFITRALDAGKQVLTPTSQVMVGGAERLAWLEIDPESGEAIGVFDDGTHGVFMEWAAVEAENPAYNPNVQFNLGVLEGVIGSGMLISIVKLMIGAMVPSQDVDAGLFLTFWFKNQLTTLLGAYERATSTIPMTTEFRLGLFAGTLVAWKYANDPPVDGVYVGPARMDALRDLDSLGGPLATKVVFDPLYFVRRDGAEVRSVFRVGIKNATSDAQMYRVELDQVPIGFLGQATVETITVPAGETAEVGIALRPIGPLDPPGTDAPFRVTVTPVTSPGDAIATVVPFTVPEIRGVVLSTDPTPVETLPGTPATVALRVRSISNVTQSVHLTSRESHDLAMSGLSDVVIGPGETVVQSLVLTPADTIPVGSPLSALIEADFGGQLTESHLISMRITVPGVAAIAIAAEAANRMGKTDLYARLRDLSVALTDVTQDPSSAVARSQSLGALDAVIRLLGADPALAPFAGPLAAARDVFAAATTTDEIRDAVTNLGQVLEDFGDAAAQLADHNIEAFLLPASQVVYPQTPAVFELRVHHIGASLDPTTYHVALGNLPAGVTGTLSLDQVSLARDEFATVLATLTPTSTSELVPFEFDIIVTADGSPFVQRTVHGALTARREFVSIVSLAATPPFVDAGGLVVVNARVLNAVNRAQRGRASFLVRDSNGAEVLGPSTPVDVELTVDTSLVDVDLGTIDTTGLADGNYIIKMALVDEADNPIPGGTGTTNLLIGSPVTATINVGPVNLPPGTSTVTNTLEILATADALHAPFLVGHAPVAGATDAVREGDLAYVASPSGIRIFDVSDEFHPALVGTFGASAEIVRIRGDRLYVGRHSLGTNDPMFLTIYSLADPLAPALLGATAPIPYNYLHDMVVTDTHVYLVQVKLCYFLFTGDIFEQNGDILAVNIMDPAAPFLERVLFNTKGTNNDGIGSVGGCNANGGESFVWSAAQADATTLLITGSTSVGTDTLIGVGRVLVVNIDSADPAWMTVTNELQIPGTNQVIGIAIDGDRALITADSGNFEEPVSDFAFTGDGILGILDIADPKNPILLHTQQFSSPPRLPGRPTRIDSHRFAFGSHEQANTEPRLHLVDTTDPTHLVVLDIDIAATTWGRLSADSEFVYTGTTSGLTIYRVASEAWGLPVTANVRIPNGTGVAIVGGSFNVAPDQIIPGADFDTLVWDLTLTSADRPQSLTWETTISDLQVGETRTAISGGHVDFSILGSPGYVALSDREVFADQIMRMFPAEHTVRPGDTAPFLVLITNPSDLEVTYELSALGLPIAPIDMPPSVTVWPGGTVVFEMNVPTDPFSTVPTLDFLLTATVDNVTGSVTGRVVLEGDPAIPEVDPAAHGVVLALTPDVATAGQGTAARYIARITNTGSGEEMFYLSTTDAPYGFPAAFDTDYITVPPGASNFRDVGITIHVPVGSTPGDYLFFVNATSTSVGEATDQRDATLTVVNSGVDVELRPSQSAPGGQFELVVTNTGDQTDTFDMTLVAPAALFATLEIDTTTLAPSESRTIPIQLGDADWALPGALALIGVARSRTHADVHDQAEGSVNIMGTKGLDLELEPAHRELAQPGPALFHVIVGNTGNIEDEYSATIVGVSGPVSASLVGLDGQPTNQISRFFLPGLMTGALELEARLTAPGTGSIQIRVQSLSDPNNSSTVVATVGHEAVETDLGLECSPLRAGWNTCIVRGATPGGVVNLAIGSLPGERHLARFGVAVDILDPQIVAQGVVQPDGLATVRIFVSEAMLETPLLMQAFEQAPTPGVTNIVIIGSRLRAAPGEGRGAMPVASGLAQAAFEEAQRRWIAAASLTRAPLEVVQRLDRIDLRVGDLAPGILGQTVDSTIYLDDDAAGHGWFVDTTFGDDVEFEVTDGGVLTASASTLASRRFDLLTVMMHEVGHILGYEDQPSPSSNIMAGTLPLGVRRSLGEGPHESGSRGPVFHNPIQPRDANADGQVTSADAIHLLTQLARRGARQLVADDVALGFLDVDGNGHITTGDLLAVLRDLGTRFSESNSGRNDDSLDAEGEESQRAEFEDADMWYFPWIEDLVRDSKRNRLDDQAARQAVYAALDDFEIASNTPTASGNSSSTNCSADSSASRYSARRRK